MKVARHIVDARRERLAQLIDQHRYLPVRELCQRLKISEATLRRDLAALELDNKITRTYGGALSEFNERFPSFRERQQRARRAKTLVARAAVTLCRPDTICFFDTGTTIFAVAEAFCANPVTPITIVTPSLPVAELLAQIDGVEVFLPAGQLFPRQSVLLGKEAQRSLEFWRFDLALLSSEAVNAEGVWNTQPDIVEQQRVALRRSASSAFCIDSTKIGRKAPYFLASPRDIGLLVTDASKAKLAKIGLILAASQYLDALRPVPPSGESPQENEQEGGELPVHVL